MCTERKATGLFVLADFLCDNAMCVSLCVTSHAAPLMRRNMIFPTMWYVRPAKAQTSLEAIEGFLGIQGYWQKLKGIRDIFVNI